jgi:DNA invertase Pin-like site-specific DNA recombinase
LPSDEELKNLASEYLIVQRKNFPELARQEMLPTPTLEIIAAMVENFKKRHGGAQIDPELLSAYRKLKMTFAGSYARYSCDNSKPSSILDQTRNNLNKAASEKRFVPWEYVFPDYSVSGLKSCRAGYTSYKRVLQDHSHYIETTYIDDFTRASRDELEWWQLANLTKRLKKRLIGSSDGFDLNSEMGEIMLRMFNILSLLFLKQLRQKVGRGMRRAAEQGTTLGRLRLGFTRRNRLDVNGSPMINPDGSPVTEPCIDPDTAEIVRRIVFLFIEKRLSVYRIACMFNQEKVDGWNRWTDRTIYQILMSTNLIGVFIWNQFRREYDYEQKKFVKIRNPRSEWKVFFNQSLALISLEQWSKLRRRLVETRQRPRAKAPSRNEKYPTTLLSGVLKCGYCEDRDLTLLRSTNKYKVFFCPNGAHKANDCQLATSKSTRIVENAVLGFLKDHVLTEKAVANLLEKANKHIAQELAKPPKKTQKLTAEIRREKQRIDRLVEQVASEDDSEVRAAYHRQIKKLQTSLTEKMTAKRKLEPIAKEILKPLDLPTLMVYLGKIREVLNQDVAMAAPVLRALTGPITIYQGPKSERRSKGAIWKAVFSPNLPGCLAEIARENSYPDSLTLEYLCERIWISAKFVEVTIDYAPKYQRVAAALCADKAAGVLT